MALCAGASVSLTDRAHGTVNTCSLHVCPVTRLAGTKVASVESLVHAFAFSQSVPDNHRWVKMLVLSLDVVVMSHPLPHPFSPTKALEFTNSSIDFTICSAKLGVGASFCLFLV